MKWGRSLLVVFLSLSLISVLSSQVRQTGSIKGTVVDPGRTPLPGVSITLTGPALLGSLTTTTREDGTFRVPGVPPGKDYAILVELPGFQPVRREGVIVSLGMTITLIIEIKPSDISTEISVVASSPTVDVAQSKIVQRVSLENISKLPLARDLVSAIQLGAGVVGRSIHGAGNNDFGYMIDGIQMNEPNQNYMQADEISWDVIEEVEVVTGAVPAEVFNAAGGFVNVLTKSGGNKFTGGAQVLYTGKNLTQNLLPDSDLSALGIIRPAAPIHNIDASFTLGGPIIKDRICFFGSLRRLLNKRSGNFRPTTILGTQYNPFDYDAKDWYSFGKLSFQISKNLRLFTMVHYMTRYVPLYYTEWYKTWEASKQDDKARINYSSNLQWIVNPSTVVDAKFGGLWYHWVGNYPEGTDQNSPQFIDSYTSYLWGNSDLAEFTRKAVTYGSLMLTHFKDNFLAGNHELKLGFEIQRNRGDWGYRRPNPMYWYYYNGNPYYYRGLYGLNGPHPTFGDGRLAFLAIGPNEGDSHSNGLDLRFGGFIQDSWTIKNRLTINIGARYDTIKAWVPGSVKEAAGTELARAIGATYFVPKYGFNPYERLTWDKWDNAFPYKFLSPNIGMTFDIFGDGKTAAKTTYARQAEALPTGTFTYLDVVNSFSFNWWDLNGNGQPDLPGVDRFEPFGTSPLAMGSTAYLDSIDPKVKIPYNEEFTLALEHELFDDWRVSVSYINRSRKNVMSRVLYDVASGKYWNTYEKAPEWWVPFTTTIPAYKGYPATPVTLYFQSINAPSEFYRLGNVPEATNKYQAIEFSFNKRMSRGWQLGGSVVLSSLKGNYDNSGGTMYSMSSFQNPNWSINRDGNLSFSRPLLIKLFGTFTLPYSVMASFFYRHEDGAPWGRTVTVVPPSAWAAANNAKTWSYNINVETKVRRNQSKDEVDLRVEKEFSFGRHGKLGLFVDLYNLLGRTEILITKNPGGTWKPADANTTVGSFGPGWTGVTGATGQRICKLSIRYSF